MNIVQSQLYIPNTVEKMLVYLSGALIQGVPGKEFTEADNSRPEPVAYTTIFRCPDGSLRVVGRYSFPVAADYMTSTGPFWEKVGIVADMDLPANFRKP